jgi:hypothetical protein
MGADVIEHDKCDERCTKMLDVKHERRRLSDTILRTRLNLLITGYSGRFS